MLSILFTIERFLSERFSRDERGATAVEYGLIVVLIAAVIVALVAAVGQDVKTGFDTVDKAMP